MRHNAPAQKPPRQRHAPKRDAHQHKKAQKRFSLLPLFLVGICVATIVFSAKLLLRDASQMPEAPFTAQAEDVFAPADEERGFIVALDAGHGGADGGAIGYVQETQLTESTVQFLGELLEQDENYHPLFCRAQGETATNELRRQRAADGNAQLLLSIHGNTDPGGTATGFDCFPAPPGRKYHDESLRMAQLIALRMGDAGQRLRGEGGVRYTYYELNRKGQYEKLVVEQSAEQPTGLESFGMLDETACPAVLIEQCFITSRTDTEAWASEEGCRRAAQIYYEAICAFFGTEPVYDESV